MNSASHSTPPGVVVFSPVVGVRLQRVQQVVAELLGTAGHTYIPPTVSCPLAHLVAPREYKAWRFNERQPDVDNELGDLVDAVRTTGLSFMRSLTTMPAALNALEDGHGHDREYKRPVLKMLMGDREGALAALDEAEALRAGKTYPEAEQYRRFATGFRSRDW